MSAPLPTGIVGFLFTDVVDSVRLWEADPAAMASAHECHATLLQAAAAAHGGTVYLAVGDACCAAFPSAAHAVAAALDAQLNFVDHDWGACGLEDPLQVRMAIHAATAVPDADGIYRSPVLNRLGRLLPAAHGGQVVLTQAAAETARDRLPPDADLLGLGPQRLRGFERPEFAWQLLHPRLPDRFPPLATLATIPHNLPAPVTRLIDREMELEQLRTAVTDVRLLTLTGPGGVGKTRLALAVATAVLDGFPDGVWFIDASALTDAAGLPAEVAAALGVNVVGPRSLGDALHDYLRERRLLLVLDNLEQLVATAHVPVTMLLAAGSGIRILATSRVRLGVSGEHEIPVNPLMTSGPNAPAVILFAERAVAARPGFALGPTNLPQVTAVCDRLDGLPLAIELAAARTKHIAPDQLLTRLERRLPLLTDGPRDLPARKRTLRSTLVWSHDLLSLEEQMLFRRLAVFAGGARFDDAVAVTDPDGTLDATVRMAALVDHSLLRIEAGTGSETQFRMLETVREFALESLNNSVDANDVRERHCLAYLALAETARSHLNGPNQPEWLDRLELEHTNFREALRWANAERRVEALHLGAALWLFWLKRGHWNEGRTQLELILESGEPVPRASRAEVLLGAGAIAGVQGDLVAAERYFTQSLAMSNQVGWRSGRARALTNLAISVLYRNEGGAAIPLLTEALTLYDLPEDEAWAAAATTFLGLATIGTGDAKRGIALCESGLARQRAIGDRWGAANTSISYGDVLVSLGEHARAAAVYIESLMEWQNTSEMILWPLAGLAGLAGAASATGRPFEAARLIGAIEAASERASITLWPILAMRVAAATTAAQAVLGADVVDAARASGRAATLPEIVMDAMQLADDIRSC